MAAGSVSYGREAFPLLARRALPFGRQDRLGGRRLARVCGAAGTRAVGSGAGGETGEERAVSVTSMRSVPERRGVPGSGSGTKGVSWARGQVQGSGRGAGEPGAGPCSPEQAEAGPGWSAPRRSAPWRAAGGRGRRAEGGRAVRACGRAAGGDGKRVGWQAAGSRRSPPSGPPGFLGAPPQDPRVSEAGQRLGRGGRAQLVSDCQVRDARQAADTVPGVGARPAGGPRWRGVVSALAPPEHQG